ncbi:MAG: helix-turn-helix domain-containing protein [Gaiellaceae bacterium]
MTSGQLIRSARLQAGLTQAELAERLAVPTSSIGRWENDTVEPGYSTLRGVLQACGFDLPPVLELYEPDQKLDARIEEVRRLTPQERLAKMLTRRRLWALDPYALLRELEYARVSYVVIGGLARIIHGSQETTEDLDITPSLRPDNLRRLAEALEALNARRVDMQPLRIEELDPEQEPWVPLVCEGGELHVVARPRGTRGYDDLRRRANREALGEGLRPSVADPADLVRMLEAHDVPVRDPHVLPTMRRLLELGHSIER